MNHYLYLLLTFAGLLIAIPSSKAQITNLEAAYLKSSSTEIVERLYTALNVIGDKATPSLERKLIINNTLEQLFYNKDVIIEDDLLPARDEERNTKATVNGDWQLKIVSINFEQARNDYQLAIIIDAPKAPEKQQPKEKKEAPKIEEETPKLIIKPKEKIVKKEKLPKEDKKIKQDNTKRIEKKKETEIAIRKTDLPQAVIDYDLDVKFNERVREERIGGVNYLFTNVFLPGVGHSKVQQKSKYWVSVTYLTLLATAGYTRINSNQNYEAYQAETIDLEERDLLFKRANRDNKIAIVTAGATALLWLYDNTATLVHSLKNVKKQKAIKKELGITYHKLNEEQNALSLNLTLNF